MVDVAHDGPSGLKAAHDFRPDILLLDIGLPGIDGYELARRLRADGFASAFIVAISGYAHEGESKSRAPPDSTVISRNPSSSTTHSGSRLALGAPGAYYATKRRAPVSQGCDGKGGRCATLEMGGRLAVESALKGWLNKEEQTDAWADLGSRCRPPAQGRSSRPRTWQAGPTRPARSSARSQSVGGTSRRTRISFSPSSIGHRCRSELTL